MKLFLNGGMNYLRYEIDGWTYGICYDYKGHNSWFIADAMDDDYEFDYL